jgi:HEAT repeat protein
VLVCAGLLWPLAVPAQPAAEPAYYKGKPTSFWIKKLADEEVSVRREAAAALGVIGPEGAAAVPALLQALDDEDTTVRQEALTTLGRIGPAARAAVPVLLHALRDKDTDYRVLTLQALGGIGPENEAVVPTLVKMLLDDDREKMRFTATGILKTFGSKARAAIPELARGLKRNDVGVRNAAAAVLGSIGPEALPQLLTVVRDPERDIRQTVNEALRNMGPKARDAIPVLTEVLKSEDNFEDRRAAVWVLAEIGPDALPVLIQALQDQANDVRRAAVQAIAKLGPGAKTRPALVPLIEQFKNDNVGGEAIGPVVAFGTEAVEPLLDALKSRTKTPNSHNCCQQALVQLGAKAKGIIPSLIEMLKGEDPSLRGTADAVLQSIGADAVPALVKAIRDKTNDYADGTLGRLGAKARPAIPELVKLLKDTDPKLRLRAVRCLLQLGPEADDALPALREAAQDGDLTVRRFAEQAVRNAEGRRR